ncbi:MAG: carboxylesterase/lipase family protein, partial [Acidobacteriota bacterium]|nr:carboxylesterase/lipase family protein [Acidobacteriota bacterium]
MNNHPTKSKAINRRSMLTRGAALVGGATAGLGLAASAHADDAAQNAMKTAARPEAKAASMAASPNMNPPVVEVKGGKLRGFRDGRTVTFLGVPYAEAERFEMPKPVKAWEGIKNAQTWGPICPIPQAHAIGGDDFVFPHRFWVENEHCQVLNIWTQSTAAAAKKPVMVWMHGGGFTNGSSMESYAYDGKTLSEFGDVVAVSLNHRLNVIGTLDVSAYGPEYTNSRNTGMADLVAALEWIHENIEAFGGDPGNVTIFGQSGGGGKVTRLMHMPAAKGLFHKVICESGSNVDYRNSDPAEVIKAQQAIAAETLKRLGVDAGKLKTVPYYDLLAAATAAKQAAGRQGGGAGWDPVADDQYVLREFCDWADSIPYMAGTTLTEFTSNMAKGELTKNEWTQAEIDEQLTKAFGDKKDAIV